MKHKVLILISIIIALAFAGSAYAGCGCASAQAAAPTTYATAETQGIHEPGTGIENPEIMQQGTGQGLNATPELISAEAPVQQRIMEKQHVETQIQQKQMMLNQELQGYGPKEQKVYQNQNQVRLAVHSLLAMENLTGGIGPQVSSIAMQFNNSVQSTIRLEQKIQNRSGFARFFAGGDNEAGNELKQYTNQNQMRIEQLEQLKNSCACDNETRAMMMQQIQLMQNETARLQLLAEKEQTSKGLFGWLWK